LLSSWAVALHHLDLVLAGVWINPPNRHELVDQVASTMTILNQAIGIAVRELAASAPQY
jgi:hypothetical protein